MFERMTHLTNDGFDKIANAVLEQKSPVMKKLTDLMFGSNNEHRDIGCDDTFLYSEEETTSITAQRVFRNGKDTLGSITVHSGYARLNRKFYVQPTPSTYLVKSSSIPSTTVAAAIRSGWTPQKLVDQMVDIDLASVHFYTSHQDFPKAMQIRVMDNSKPVAVELSVTIEMYAPGEMYTLMSEVEEALRQRIFN